MKEVLQQYFKNANLDLNRGGLVYVAFSGGLDSTVLLHAAIALLDEEKLKGKLKAVHINHGLQEKAEEWQQHCERFCSDSDVELIVENLNLSLDESSLEDKARQGRYQSFENIVQEGDILLMAHHLNDQSETLFLNLVRGNGPKGLSGMPNTRPLGQGYLHRPFLGLSKQDLMEYAIKRKLQWVEDESNQDNRFSRNFIRNEIIPKLKERWPELENNMSRSQFLLRETDKFVEEIAHKDYQDAPPSPFLSCWGENISIAYLLTLSETRRNNLLRYWFRLFSLRLPSKAIQDNIGRQLLLSENDAQPEIQWASGEQRVFLRRFQDHIFLMSDNVRIQEDGSNGTDWDLLEMPEMKTRNGRMSHSNTSVQANSQKKFLKNDIDALEIRYREGGERCRPSERAHSQSLKKLLQEYRVPPWCRDDLPLLYWRGELVAVADLWICHGYQTDVAEEGKCLNYQYLQRAKAI